MTFPPRQGPHEARPSTRERTGRSEKEELDKAITAARSKFINGIKTGAPASNIAKLMKKLEGSLREEPERSESALTISDDPQICELPG